MKFVFLIFLFLISSTAQSWGERGHDLVTRIAVKQLQSAYDFGPDLTQPFVQRDHLLSHLSNAPDFHWRATYMPWYLKGLNSPTHYIGLEHVYPSRPELLELDLSIEHFYRLASENGHEDPAKLGTAPWRALQFHALMTDALKQVKRADSRDTMIEATNQALFYAGLLSHFVGDLANPHHTTENHDGQLTGNTGLHAYFEDRVVRALPMTLAGDIDAASSSVLSEVILKQYDDAAKAEILNDASKLVFALVLDSFSKVDKLHQLDDQHSILKRSTSEDEDAERKPAENVTQAYGDFIVERLAAGASVLARLWLLAWLQADQPDLSDFHSYRYFVAPEFISPDYLQ